MIALTSQILSWCLFKGSLISVKQAKRGWGVGVIFKAMSVSMAFKKKKSVSQKTHREILLQNLNLRGDCRGNDYKMAAQSQGHLMSYVTTIGREE